jgi:beta-glucosidase
MSPWSPAVPAIVQSWYAGMEGGHGLADVLLGRHNADGRLPFSIPTTDAHLPDFHAEAASFSYDRWHGWWKLERDGHAPQFPFGFGLSYTVFSLGDFAVTRSGDAAVVRGSITNSGDRHGADVVQVYGSHGPEDPGVRPPRLVGFSRVEVPPGQEVPVEIIVPLDQFAVRDPATHQWKVRPGRYALRICRHVSDRAAHSLTFELDDD